jgi:hypothetical protein
MRTGIDAVNRGVEALKGVVTKQQDVQDTQQELQSDLDLDNLRAMAKEQLGGKQAGETLEDYNAAIDGFLKDTGALTENIGSKDINAFKTDFEQFVTGQRDVQEERATTLESKRRSDVAYDRAEKEFGRKELERTSNNNARQIVAAHNTQTDTLKKRLVAGETLTAEETRFLSTDGNIKALEGQFRGLTDANPVFMDSLLNREIAAKQRLTLSPAEQAALSKRNTQEERFYKEQIGAMGFRNSLIKDRIGKLETAIPLEPGDVAGGVSRFAEGIRGLAGEDLDIKVGDDVITEVQALMVDYIAQGHHPEDIASAALASTEVAENILGFRYDETLDTDQFVQNLKFAKNARESRQRQVANLEALGGSTLTQAPPGQPTNPLGTSASTQAAAVDLPSLPAPPVPATAPVSTTETQVQGLRADAAALEPGQPESTLTQAEEAKAAEVNDSPTEAKTPTELKVIAINQLTKAEAPQVEANLEAAIEKLPKASAATSAQDIIRKELIVKLGALRGRISALESPQGPTAADTLNAAVANSGVLTAPQFPN